MNNAPQILIDRVRPLLIQISQKEKESAAKVAIQAYIDTLQKLELFGDFDLETNEELAAETAAAEILFRFT